LDLINYLRANPLHKQQVPEKPIAGDVISWLEHAYQLGIGTKDYNLVTLASDGTPAVDGGAAIDGGAADMAG
jgi:hypothetical protein